MSLSRKYKDLILDLHINEFTISEISKKLGIGEMIIKRFIKNINKLEKQKN